MDKSTYYTWSYEKNADLPDSVKIEHILKYGDVEDIKEILIEFGKEKCISVWKKSVLNEDGFDRTNYFLARFIFKISDNYDSDNYNIIMEYLKTNKKSRFE